jgi:hypothetical protein
LSAFLQIVTFALTGSILGPSLFAQHRACPATIFLAILVTFPFPYLRIVYFKKSLHCLPVDGSHCTVTSRSRRDIWGISAQQKRQCVDEVSRFWSLRRGPLPQKTENKDYALKQKFVLYSSVDIGVLYYLSRTRCPKSTINSLITDVTY